ncbi:MAG: tRNA (adenosine(37)-N6)-threonylcarbamoyltransferase complex ATPase subunit type 1 TsaE [Candidatus Moranbacteria bacterium]|nr:tRNA (adenosine(37)-N6)-threonylcarbamoyltransferase complex ATPase subunit type 1 TsaE [Candidatus Moranbacteria bacterium]MDD3964599.1 tRNA (adenosine(37)-N6)-threonylcarbamoyltransferase complex ATPase subunit type 1 TsaE [Candidatus Moranbacteria bacterium]
MEQHIITHSALETSAFGQKFSEEIAGGTLICLRGDLGAGKTTFTQGLLLGLGAERPFVSPTFVIMKQYNLSRPVNGIERVYHVDAYRVKSQDFTTIGFEEWLEDTKGIVILEWPERVETLLPSKRIEIHFKSISENEREISIVLLA